MDPSHPTRPFSQQQQQSSSSYQTLPTMVDVAATTAPPAVDSSLSQTPAGFAPYHQPQPFHSPQHQHQIQAFWSNQMQEIEQMTDFKNHTLPLARIKKIMKADEDVRMISAEAPIVFAKACEMFILELTLRSWIHTEENKRRTLQKNDIAAAISRTDVFDFLVDIIPRDEMKEEGLGINKAGMTFVGSPPEAMPYYYVPQQPPAVPAAASLYTAPQPPPPPPLPFMPWPHTQAQQPPTGASATK